MNQIVIDPFLTHPKAKPFRLEVDQGSRLAIMGKAGTGKTRLLQALIQSAKRPTKVYSPSFNPISGRATPQQLVKPGGSDHTAVVLTKLGLWDHRRNPFSALSPGQQRATMLASLLHLDSGLIVLDDDVIDPLDPWIQPSGLHELLQLPSEVAIVVVTQQPDVAVRFPWLVVLETGGLHFEGNPHALITGMKPVEYQIKTQDREAVRAMVEPYHLEIMSNEEGLRFTARENQAVAVDLLLKGYGTVESVLVKSPTFAEALRDLDS